MATFNGWNIIPLPSYPDADGNMVVQPGFSDIQITKRNAVGMFQSPFSMQTRVQQWVGADLILAHCVMPPMQRDEYGAAWDGFISACCGMLNVFQLPIPYNGQLVANGASALGVPIVNGSVTNNPGASILNTTGWEPASNAVLQVGDWFQIGYRIHTVLATINSDSSGNAAIPIWPSLRDTPTNQTPLILNNPMGLFRLAKNDQSVSIDTNGFYHLDLDVIEAK